MTSPSRNRVTSTLGSADPPTSTAGKVVEKYGAWGEKNNYGKKYMGIIRTTVIIDAAGKVAKVFPKVRVKGHVDAVLAAIDELRKDA